MTRLTTLDLSPFYRNSVGIDRLFDRITNQIDTASNTNYPPYNILKTGENTYEIQVAVAGFTEGEGSEKGLVIWICKTKDGKPFNVRPRGTHEERAELFKKAKNYVGQKLTVRYQELSDDGIPRFPVGITFRDYE